MVQKTTWMRSLIFGISLICANLFFQCKKHVDYLSMGTYVYFNDTDSLIEVRSGVYDFAINSKQSYIIEQRGDGSKNVSENDYVPPMTSAGVIYAGTKCDTLNSGIKVGKGEGILNLENYKSEKIGERHYKFTYTFTEVDYKKGVPCN